MIIKGRIDIDHREAPYSKKLLELPDDYLVDRFLLMISGPCEGMFRNIRHSSNGLMYLTLTFPQLLGKGSKYIIIID